MAMTMRWRLRNGECKVNSDLVGIDPGVHFCGISHFYQGKLEYAAYLPTDDMFSFICDQLPVAYRYLIECPRIYPQARQKGDQNDLINLARVVGGLERWCEGKVEIIYPREWKGTVDADVMVKRIQERLSPEEKAKAVLPSAKSKHHNVWDAVGIGLHGVGRLKQKRVYEFENGTVQV